MKPIGKDMIGPYYYQSEDFCDTMDWSAMHDMLMMGNVEKWRVYSREDYRGFWDRMKGATCCICGQGDPNNKTITILIMADKDGGKETKVGNAKFCDYHFKKIMAAAMKDKLGVIG